MKAASNKRVPRSDAEWRASRGISHRRYYIRRVAALQKASDRGSSEASYSLGNLLQEGVADTRGRQVVAPAPKEAVAAYRRALELGEKDAVLALAYCYDTGFGVRTDKRRAFLAYLKLWKTRRNQCAANNIATIYRDRGDMRRAFVWWSKAAATNDGDAFVDVGYCLYYGFGVRRNVAKALAAFRRACRSRYICDWGVEEALYHRSVALLDRGGRRDRAKAKLLLKRANEDDDYPEARDILAQLDAKTDPVTICRCRRHLRRRVGGHARCELHR